MQTEAVHKAHPIPRECLRQHVAVLGKTGSGKTYAAKGMVEELIRENARVCILDPTGAWWGLRLEADGKGRGLPVVILGGDHADVPINESAGAAVGEMVATQQMQVIVDLSRTELGERAGYEASGGSFARYCSTLRSLKLIEYPRKTTAKASAWLLQ